MITERPIAVSISTPAPALASGAVAAVRAARAPRLTTQFHAPAAHERPQGWNLSHSFKNAEGNQL